MQGGGEAALARIVYEGSPARAAPAGEPAPLPANPLPQRMNFSGALRITLPIDGRKAAALDLVPLFAAARGRTVVMALDNRDTAAHVVTSTAITFACSTASMTAGSPIGSTPSRWQDGRPRALRSSQTTRAAG